ncbi:glutamine amidotransferase family protein [soil metagenome]
MCGIAGRISGPDGRVGADLVELMQAQRHRGSDSTGFGLYGPARRRGYVVRMVVFDRRHLAESLEAFASASRSKGADLLEDPTWDDLDQSHVSVRLVVEDPDDEFGVWLFAVDHLPGIEIQSVGRSLEIIKDLGNAYTVADKHDVRTFMGSHGLSNARMATESKVAPTAAHPFWARPFPDVAISHNGQLTNYYLLKDRLTRHGYDFKTENDSELIAVWVADQMSRGLSLEEALELSKSALDGVFTYILATIDRVVFAKDRWAIKPLAVVEEEHGGLALATEEQALRHLFVDEVEVINYDGPSQSHLWTLPRQAVPA